MNIKGVLVAMVVAYGTICLSTRVSFLKNLAGL